MYHGQVASTKKIWKKSVQRTFRDVSQTSDIALPVKHRNSFQYGKRVEVVGRRPIRDKI